MRWLAGVAAVAVLGLLERSSTMVLASMSGETQELGPPGQSYWEVERKDVSSGAGSRRGGGGGGGGQGYAGSSGKPLAIGRRTRGGGGGYSHGGGGRDKDRSCTVCSVLAPLALLGSLLPLLSFGYVTVSTGRRRRRRGVDDHLVDEKLQEFTQVQQYVQQNLDQGVEFNLQDDIIARYLSCSGLTVAENHCLEHLACSLADPFVSHTAAQRTAIAVVLHTVQQNQRVNPELKTRLEEAGEAGRRHPGSCLRYSCSLPSATALTTLHDHPDAHAVGGGGGGSSPRPHIEAVLGPQSFEPSREEGRTVTHRNKPWDF